MLEGTSPMRTLTLPEYKQLQHVHLTSADLAALVHRTPKQLAIAPAMDGSGYDLTANSWVGTLTTPNLALILAPKIPLPRLLFLLSYTLDPARWRDMPFNYESAPDVVEAIIPGFVHQVRRAIRTGLLQGYRHFDESLTVVRGRVDFPRQIRRHLGRMPPVEVTYDEFSEDIPENQLLKAAITALGRLELRSRTSRTSLRTLQSAFGRVSLRSFAPGQFPAIQFNRLTEHYRPAVQLARLILEATSFDLRHGTTRSSAFLVNMNTVFERFVTVALREALGTDDRSFPPQQRAPKLHLDTDDNVHLRPDLTWIHRGQRRFVGDVKYKRLTSAGYLHADLYQALAYAVATGLTDVTLVYPVSEAHDTTHIIDAVGKRIHVRTLDLHQDPEQILSRIARLAEEIRQQALTQPNLPSAA